MYHYPKYVIHFVKRVEIGNLCSLHEIRFYAKIIITRFNCNIHISNVKNILWVIFVLFDLRRFCYNIACTKFLEKYADPRLILMQMELLWCNKDKGNYD